jgi:cobalt/nickel transport system permease protein
MHIPDGYLGPQTYVPLFGATAVFWGIAANKVKKTLKARQVPLLALMAAFSFVVMMFNLPLPGGTTGHAVGAVLSAIVIGPWASVIAVSIALIIQALLFGDGGITAVGANCFNMGVVMPFVGYWAYKAISAGEDVSPTRRWIGAGVAGYVALTVAAFVAAVEFGLQPMIAHTADGQPLYGPYPLSVAIPAMVGGHMILFSFVEGVVTALVVAYIAKSDKSLFYQYQPAIGKY